jgi:hypothetical protein
VIVAAEATAQAGVARIHSSPVFAGRSARAQDAAGEYLTYARIVRLPR